MAAALGGLLLDDGVKDVEKAVQTGNIPGLNLAAAPVDESTKLALKVAVGLLVVVGVTAGATSCCTTSTALLRRQCGCRELRQLRHQIKPQSWPSRWLWPVW